LLLVDLTLATRSHVLTGIERYGVSLFAALRDNHPRVYAAASRGSVLEGQDRVVCVPAGVCGWLTLPAFLMREGHFPDVLVAPSFPPSPLFAITKCRTLRIVHDPFPWTRTQDLSFRGRLMFHHLETAMLGHYTWIGAPTPIVAADLEARFDRPVRCTGNAPGFDPVHGETSEIADLPERFVLAVGTVEPRKNYEHLAWLSECLPDPGMVLVIAGRPGWGASAKALEEAAHREPHRLIWLRDTSDAGLRWLYRRCSAFVSLSHAEGFNMPLVEAGIAGRPIICSDLPIHREVAPGWAQFVPVDVPPGEFEEALRIVAKRDIPANDRAAYARRFGWSHVAERVVEIVGG
jgi:glycosyltransferase involved in cell wall biosynthesis